MSGGFIPGRIRTGGAGSGSYILLYDQRPREGIWHDGCIYHVPPGVSRRSKTWMISNASSASKAAAAAAPVKLRAAVRSECVPCIRTSCASSDDG